jgi:protein ImuB
LPHTTETALFALRILRPARQVRVQLTDGRPAKLAMLTRDGDCDELQGAILWAAGPWRSSGEWWAERPANHAQEEPSIWEREEWDVALANNDGTSVALYRIYRDIGTGRWFADASYD